MFEKRVVTVGSKYDARQLWSQLTAEAQERTTSAQLALTVWASCLLAALVVPIEWVGALWFVGAWFAPVRSVALRIRAAMTLHKQGWEWEPVPIDARSYAWRSIARIVTGPSWTLSALLLLVAAQGGNKNALEFLGWAFASVVIVLFPGQAWLSWCVWRTPEEGRPGSFSVWAGATLLTAGTAAFLFPPGEALAITVFVSMLAGLSWTFVRRSEGTSTRSHELAKSALRRLRAPAAAEVGTLTLIEDSVSEGGLAVSDPGQLSVADRPVL